MDLWFSTEVEEKSTNVLPDLTLKVSQYTSPIKAHKTYVFANNADKITMTSGNYSSEFNSRMHQMKFTGWLNTVPKMLLIWNQDHLHAMKPK